MAFIQKGPVLKYTRKQNIYQILNLLTFGLVFITTQKMLQGKGLFLKLKVLNFSVLKHRSQEIILFFLKLIT